MRVEVRLYATLRKYEPPGAGTPFVDVAEGTTLSDLEKLLGIPQQEDRVVLINGRPGKPDFALRDGDRVVMFPPVTGG